MINKLFFKSNIKGIPQSYFGKNTISILKIFENLEIICFYSESASKLSYFENLKNYLSKCNVRYISIGFNRKEYLEKLVKKLNGDIDLVIGVGGGKVLDSTKYLRDLIIKRDQKLVSRDDDYILNMEVPMILIPTTIGTGSQVNGTVVLNNLDQKFSMTDIRYIPSVSIHDTMFHIYFNKKIIAFAIADILNHLIEGYHSRLAKDIHKDYARLGMNYLRKILDDNPLVNPNHKNMLNLNYASYYGGIIVGNVFVGACHALAHVLEEMMEISHGEAVLIFTLINIEYHCKYSKTPILWLEAKEIYRKLKLKDYVDLIKLRDIDREELIIKVISGNTINTDEIRFNEEKLEELLSEMKF